MIGLSYSEINSKLPEEKLNQLKEYIIRELQKTGTLELAFAICNVADEDLKHRILQDPKFVQKVNRLIAQQKAKLIEIFEKNLAHKNPATQMAAASKLLVLRMPEEFGRAASQAKSENLTDEIPSIIEVEGVENEEDYATLDPEDIQVDSDSEDKAIEEDDEESQNIMDSLGINEFEE